MSNLVSYQGLVSQNFSNYSRNPKCVLNTNNTSGISKNFQEWIGSYHPEAPPMRFVTFPTPDPCMLESEARTSLTFFSQRRLGHRTGLRDEESRWRARRANCAEKFRFRPSLPFPYFHSRNSGPETNIFQRMTSPSVLVSNLCAWPQKDNSS